MMESFLSSERLQSKPLRFSVPKPMAKDGHLPVKFPGHRPGLPGNPISSYLVDLDPAVRFPVKKRSEPIPLSYIEIPEEKQPKDRQGVGVFHKPLLALKRTPRLSFSAVLKAPPSLLR